MSFSLRFGAHHSAHVLGSNCNGYCVVLSGRCICGADYASWRSALQVHEGAVGGKPRVLQGLGEAGFGQTTRKSQLAGTAGAQSTQSPAHLAMRVNEML